MNRILTSQAISALFPAGISLFGAEFSGPEGLKGASQLIEQVVERINPAVVEIEVKSVAVREPEKDPDSTANLTHDHCSGTGVILTPGGEILTNHHIVSRARQITEDGFGSTESYTAR